MKRKNKDEGVILVYYIDVRQVGEDYLEQFMTRVMKQIQTQSIEAEIIAIPVWSETRIECINPKYITNKELIKEHEEKMKLLSEHVKGFIIESKLNKEEDGK